MICLQETNTEADGGHGECLTSTLNTTLTSTLTSNLLYSDSPPPPEQQQQQEDKRSPQDKRTPPQSQDKHPKMRKRRGFLERCGLLYEYTRIHTWKNTVRVNTARRSFLFSSLLTS